MNTSDCLNNILDMCSHPNLLHSELCTFFTLTRVFKGKKSIEDLAKESDISKNEIEKAVTSLIDSQLAARTEENLIEPKNDVSSFFLNFVSMAIVHSGHTDSKDR